MAPVLKGMELAQDGAVWTLALRSSPHPKGGFENRFNPDFCAEIHKALDVVTSTTGPCALIITGDGKYFSNGLDLAWMRQHPQRGGEAPLAFMSVAGRLLTLPVVTVAAVNGHAYAGGFLLSLACDYRGGQAAERAHLCLNEVELGMPRKPDAVYWSTLAAINALLAAKLRDGPALRDTVLHARRWTAAEARDHGFFDWVSPTSAGLLAEARKVGALHAKRCANRRLYHTLKRAMWKDAAAVFDDGAAGRSAGGTTKGARL